MDIIIQLLIIVLLTFLNAFFASAEMAIVSYDKIKIKTKADEGDHKSKLLLKLLEEPSKFLATIQVGITLAGFFSSASAATGLSKEFSKILEGMHIPYSEQLSVIIITFILSYFMLVFGELFPKRLALQRTEKIALSSVKPIYYISKIAAPFIKLLSLSTNLLMRIFGIDNENLEQEVSKEQIKSLVKVGQEHGVINQTEKRMINNIFNFDDTLAKEVMTSRVDVFMVDVNSNINDVLTSLNVNKYSRIPVYDQAKDNIVGILYMKAILLKINNINELSIKDCMREAYFVPETKPIDELFIALQNNKKHMAVLLDEYGVFSGIVTMEDLIEEIMGDILDEFDQEVKSIEKVDSKTYIVNGGLSVEDFNRQFQTKIKDNHATTISGFMINQLGYVPSSELINDMVVKFKNMTLLPLEIENYMIKKIKVVIE